MHFVLQMLGPSSPETTEGKEPTATIWHISEIQAFEDGLLISVSFNVRCCLVSVAQTTFVISMVLFIHFLY